MDGKIYAGILVDRVRRVTEGLPDDEWGFRSGRCFLDKIFTLKQIVRKNVCRFYGLRERV